MAYTDRRMWFITQCAVGLCSSLLQDVLNSRNAQGLIKELGKFLKKILQRLLKLMSLPQKDSL